MKVIIYFAVALLCVNAINVNKQDVVDTKNSNGEQGQGPKKGGDGKDDGPQKDCSKVCSKEATGNVECKHECGGCFGDEGNCDMKRCGEHCTSCAQCHNVFPVGMGFEQAVGMFQQEMMNKPTDGGNGGNDGKDGKDEKDCSAVCSKEKTGNMDCKHECGGCFGDEGNCDMKKCGEHCTPCAQCHGVFPKGMGFEQAVGMFQQEMMNKPTDGGNGGNGGKDGKDGLVENNGKGGKECSAVCSKKATGDVDCSSECGECFGPEAKCDLKKCDAHCTPCAQCLGVFPKGMGFEQAVGMHQLEQMNKSTDGGKKQ